jgi:hypothetical protein
LKVNKEMFLVFIRVGLALISMAVFKTPKTCCKVQSNPVILVMKQHITGQGYPLTVCKYVPTGTAVISKFSFPVSWFRAQTALTLS